MKRCTLFPIIISYGWLWLDPYPANILPSYCGGLAINAFTACATTFAMFYKKVALFSPELIKVFLGWIISYGQSNLTACLGLMKSDSHLGRRVPCRIHIADSGHRRRYQNFLRGNPRRLAV
ncbi:hypothetical protein C8J56DRAFT_315772 [Mycena floridula]|nr:hypothetical protein C8J56DRAFT_315772 [Mycena floridula]